MMVHRQFSRKKTSFTARWLSYFARLQGIMRFVSSNVFGASFLASPFKASISMAKIISSCPLSAGFTKFGIKNPFSNSFSRKFIISLPVIGFPLFCFLSMMLFMVDIILFLFGLEPFFIPDGPLTLVFCYFFFCLYHVYSYRVSDEKSQGGLL